MTKRDTPFIKNRFVVFLDIMGFKERVARNTQESLYKELTEFNRDITNIINNKDNINNKNVEIQPKPLHDENDSSKIDLKTGKDERNEIILAQFSDSIVIFSSGNTKDDLTAISKVSKDIMMSAIKRKKPIPLKGALAEGYITCDKAKQLFFGQALIDAYLLEENVQYYGIVVHHSAEKKVKKYAPDMFKNNLIPLKSGKINHYELVWYDNYEDAKTGLERIRLTVSDSPRKYVDNTNDLIDKIKNNKQNNKG